MAHGIGNTLCGFFSSFAGCAMIGHSIINFISGGRGHISNLVGALLLILFVISLSDHIALLPVAGIMFVVCINTFEWSSIRLLKRMPKADAVIMIAVTLVMIFTDLAMAAICGVIISALIF